MPGHRSTQNAGDQKNNPTVVKYDTSSPSSISVAAWIEEVATENPNGFLHVPDKPIPGDSQTFFKEIM